MIFRFSWVSCEKIGPLEIISLGFVRENDTTMIVPKLYNKQTYFLWANLFEEI